MDLNGLNVLVTGANRGLGRALVDALEEAGVTKIYGAARNPESLKEISEIVIPIELDVTENASVRDAAQIASDCDLVINNAGVLTFGDIMSVHEAQIRQEFEVNFYGLLRVAKEFAQVMDNRGGGALVNVLTLLSLASMPGMAAYNASKAAAWSVHLSLRATLEAKNISLHGVFPGAIDTDMLAAVEMAKASPQDVAKEIIHGLQNDAEDIFPDAMSQQVYAAWCRDHKAVEKQFATM